MPEQEQNASTNGGEDAQNPMVSLCQVFRDLAVLVGQDKADLILTKFYGVASPDALRVSDLLDAIDKLYEAA